MCCETSRRDPAGAGSVPNIGSAVFHASLLDGMHAMAQPITLLRSYFYLTQTGAPHSPQLVADATAGVEQLCVTFRLMQELVAAETVAAHLEDVSLARFLTQIAHDAEVVFAGTRVVFKMEASPGLEASLGMRSTESAQHPAPLTLLRIDPRRTRHAVLSMLHIARECSDEGSRVVCRVTTSEDWLHVACESEQSPQVLRESSLDDVTRLRLALVRVNVASQQATFEVRTDPFLLILKLPRACSTMGSVGTGSADLLQLETVGHHANPK